MHWQYTTISMEAYGWMGGKIDGDQLTNRLNELGAQGWELVSIFDTNMSEGRTRDVFAVLKRLVPEVRAVQPHPAAR